MRIPALLSIPVVLAASPVLAADPQAGVVDQLERRVRELEARILAMEARAGASGELEEVKRQIEVLAQEIEKLKVGEAAVVAEESVGGLGPAASKVYQAEKGVSIGGYGEVLYEGFDGDDESGDPSGKKSQVDFLRAIVYIGYKFDDRVLLNTEIEVEHANTEEGGAVEMEFGYLDFKLRDEVGLRAGMVLVPMGLLNELHEPPVFLSAKRTEVERRIIPTTWSDIGLGAFGDVGDFSYRAYLVNGMDAVDGGYSASGIRGGRQKGSRALAEDLALTGRLDWHGVEGLTVGASFYTGNAGQGNTAPTTGQSIDARTTLFDVHALYRARGFYARGLLVQADVDDVALLNDARELTGDDSIGEKLRGYYAEIGYDVLSLADTDQELIPFFRQEALETQAEVPAGFAADPANDIAIQTFGIAWKPIANAIVKLDYQNISNEADSGVDQANLALGWLF